jgi:23S rRNA (guanosine2251-2'-O)-methyltransferase
MKKLSMEELNRLSPEEYKDSPKIPLVIVLDNIRSLNNVGSAFRTGDAFAIEKIYLCGITGTPPHRDIEKTALGATSSVDWKHFSTTAEAIQLLKKEGYIISAFEQVSGSTFLDKWQPRKDKKYAFVFGNEVFGVEEEVLELVDEVLEIPQSGTKHSLNVSVTLGVAIWNYIIRSRD